jgi:hypothetical protein
MDTQEATTGNGPWTSHVLSQSRVRYARARFRDIDEQTRRLAREHPFAALCAALATGYFLARLASRY